MDQLVAVGDVEVPARLQARVRRVVRHQPGADTAPLIADLRTHVPRRVLVVGDGATARSLALDLHDHGLPSVVYTDDDVSLPQSVPHRWLTDPAGDMDVADDLLALIGNTPMMRLDRTGRDLDCHLLGKLELFNPGFSSKDRPALAMIDAAERDGLLQPGGTIVEPTSGNTGVGLAIVAARRGYHCVFVCPDKVATDKIAQLRAYGAEVVVCPTSVDPEHPESYYSVSDRLAREIPNAWKPDQYHNPNNPQSQYDTAGPEIWAQTKGRITHFVCGVGTGGTISGIGRYLKEQNPDIRVIGADPEGSVYSGGSGRPYLVEGIGEDFWPSTYDPDIADEIVAISDAESFAAARRVTRQEGLLIGGSGGTAIAAALRIGHDLPQDAVVVVHIPDSGRGYLSKLYDDRWMADHGFLRSSGPTVEDLLTGRDPELPLLVHTHPDETVRTAIEIMREYGVSQLPVVKAEPPVVLGEVMGSVTEVGLLDHVLADASVLERPVQDVIGPAFPTLGLGEPIDAAIATLEDASAALVLDAGHPVAVVSRADILRSMTSDQDQRR
ncbi:MAG TPA: cystathionine beta-synthase [Acidimicrobiales bacterium]|nr:cystathionine beta-synthase [Acidimicrobiales bacterium]